MPFLAVTLAWIVTALAIASCRAPAYVPADDDIVVSRLESRLHELEARGFSGFVAVAHRDGALVFARAYGAADAKRSRAYTLDTQVDIGSITKSFTGMLAADLIARGHLSLDDTLGEYFPSAPSDKASITLQQLLTHSAGLPDATGDDFEQLSRHAFLACAFAVPLESMPGTRYAYSNVGYSIAAAIIEEAGGASYEDQLIALLARAGIADRGYGRAYDPARSARDQRGRSIEASSWWPESVLKPDRQRRPDLDAALDDRLAGRLCGWENRFTRSGEDGA
jgi:CubicO group peptidase (beta-lactamase class C family)